MDEKRTRQDTRPWARYLRLSKAEAAEDRGKTKAERIALTNAKLDGHLAEVTRWLDGKDLPYSDEHVYRDPGLSAWKPGVRRPEWEEMMRRAEAGELAGIAIVAVDRFTRDVTTMEDLIRLAATTDVQIGGPRAGRLDLTTYEGIQQARGMAMQAANESLATSFRIKETLARKMAAGKPMGGGRVYGFETGGEVQRPTEVAVLREAARRMIAGEPLAQIAADLNDRGHTTARDGKWTGANLARSLSHHRYGGKVEHKGQIVGTMPGEPVFDEETYAAVHAILASRRRGRRPTRNFPLTGLLLCEKCDRTMNGATRKEPETRNRPEMMVRVYRCAPQLGGCGRSINAEVVEDMLDEFMVERLGDADNVSDVMTEDEHLTAARVEQITKLQGIEDRLVNLEVKWASGDILDAAYDRAKRTLDQQRAEVAAALADAQPTAAGITADALTLWRAAEPEERRELVRRFRVEVKIGPWEGSRGRYANPRTRVQIKQRPRKGRRAA